MTSSLFVCKTMRKILLVVEDFGTLSQFQGPAFKTGKFQYLRERLNISVFEIRKSEYKSFQLNPPTLHLRNVGNIAVSLTSGEMHRISFAAMSSPRQLHFLAMLVCIECMSVVALYDR